MKYRIKQIDDAFYPQYANFFGFWCNLKKYMGPNWYATIKCYSLDEAKSAITRHIVKNVTKVPKITIHEYK
jgi:hypothetical protein